MTTQIFGFAGRSRAGKSFSARVAYKTLLAVAPHDCLVSSFSFANLLRVLLRERYPRINFHGKAKDSVDPSTGIIPRELMQTFGDECRAKDPDIFVNAMRDSIEAHRKTLAMPIRAYFVLIDDVRFPNEVAMCDYTLHLTNPYTPIRDADAEHISECLDPRLCTRHQTSYSKQDLRLNALRMADGMLCGANIRPRFPSCCMCDFPVRDYDAGNASVTCPECGHTSGTHDSYILAACAWNTMN